MTREQFKIIKEDVEEMQTTERTVQSLINEAGNNFVALSWHRHNSIEEIREVIKDMADYYLKKLEDFTGKKTDELDKIKPGICAQYNILMEKLKNPDLKYEDFEKTVNEGIKITTFLNQY